MKEKVPSAFAPPTAHQNPQFSQETY